MFINADMSVASSLYIGLASKTLFKPILTTFTSNTVSIDILGQHVGAINCFDMV